MVRMVLALICICLARPAAGQDLSYRLSDAEAATLDQGLPVVSVWPNAQDRNRTEIFGAVDIAATPARIWSLMLDCEATLRIVADMKACDILETSPDGAWDIRRQTLDLPFPLTSVRSEFRSDYAAPTSIRITRTGGGLKELDGLWTLEPLRPDLTRVSYRAGLKPGLPAPRRVVRRANRKDMPDILVRLRTLAESGGG